MFWFLMLLLLCSFCFGFLVGFFCLFLGFEFFFVKMIGCITNRKSALYTLEERVQHIFTCHQKVHSIMILRYITKFAHNKR